VSEDRDYWFILRTVDTGALRRQALQDRLAESLVPSWRTLVAGRVLHEARAFIRIGDIDLVTDAHSPAAWQLTLLAEIADGVDPHDAARRELAETAEALAGPLTVTSRELLLRRAGSGTAVPRPRNPALPAGFTVAVEHIFVPLDRWDDYQRAMAEIFGPVGLLTLEWGIADRVTVTEVVERFERSPGLPDWNQVHILEALFSEGDEGFADACTRAVHELLGAGTNIHAELSAVAAYRRKPAMTDNAELVRVRR
jgi:hypothetical protein